MVPKIWKITKIYITRYRFLRVWYRNGTVNLRGFWGKMSPLQRGEEGRRTCVLRPSFGLWCQVKPARSEYQTIFVRSRKWSYRKAARTGNQGLYAAFPIPAIWNLPSDALLTGAPFALYGNENDHAETVVLLSKLKVDHHIEIELKMDELDLTAAESKATYDEIKAYVLNKYGLKVSQLYIAQIKRKCGIIERKNYNVSKKEDAKVPQCPPEKEAAIMDALKHFQMIWKIL